MNEIFDASEPLPNGLKPILKPTHYTFYTNGEVPIVEEKYYIIRFLKDNPENCLSQAEGLTQPEIMEVINLLTKNRRFIFYRAPQEIYTRINRMRDPRLVRIPK
jgi:hypothetical protein